MPFPVREPDFEALRLELSRQRAARGWTYDELAERTGINRRTLVAIETGERQGRLDSWHRIAQAMDVEIGDLLKSL